MQNNEFFSEEVSKFYDDITRNKMIKKELRKLKKICETLDEDRKSLAIALNENLAFLIVAQKELREIINRDGYFEQYKNGKNQYGLKRSIASELLIQMQKNYNMLFRQFKELLPQLGTYQSEFDEWDENN